MTSKLADEDEDLDPRIQEELDHLNQSSSDINRLENEIDEARSQYRSTFSESSKNMEQTGRKIRKQIQRARQYYEIKESAVLAQSEVLRSARQFQTAIGVYRAAKETIALAEMSLIDSQANQSSAAMLSSAWQEMLNHASIRVMEAEKDKTLSEKEHLRRSQMFVDLESKLQVLEKKFKTSIAKARPYFEMKAQCELKLKQQKQNVSDLQQAITSAKRKYAEALTRLENISEEIHEHRRQTILLMFPREPGVGADSDSVCSSISDACIEKKLFPSLSKSASGDVDEDDDSGSVSSDHDEAFIHADKTSHNSFPCSDTPEISRSKTNITKTNSLRKATKDSSDTVSLGSRSCGSGSKDFTDTVSLGLRSCGSGSSVDQDTKVSLDPIADSVADDSVILSSACVSEVTDSANCVLSAAEGNTEGKTNEQSEESLCREREPGSGSESQPLCTEIYKDSTSDVKQEYLSQDDSYVDDNGMAEVLQKERRIENESLSSECIDNTDLCS